MSRDSIAAWAQTHFSGADLPDLRLKKRLVKMSRTIVSQPGTSIPNAMEKWADIKGAYRFLSNPEVQPDAIQAGHREVVRGICAQESVVLCVQDTSILDFTRQKEMKNLGKVGASQCSSRGLHQHTALAVTPDGRTLGILHQRWYLRPWRPKGETASDRKQRWVEGDVWKETAETVGRLEGCRLIHVGDRGADVTGFFRACQAQGVGFLVRAQHDRRIAEGEGTGHLWPLMERQAEQGRMEVKVSFQRSARALRTPRQATLSVRFAPVVLTPHRMEAFPLYAIYLREEAADRTIEAGEPVDWMLLTGEKVEDLETAVKMAKWYMRRWRIEEFHRALKEGCGLERSQLDDAEDVKRLAAIYGVVAVRLLQLRDMADEGHPDAERPEALQAFAPPSWIRLMAHFEKVPVAKMTPRLFLRGIARKGGFIGRKGDGRPGWKTIWLGWTTVGAMMVGLEASDAMGN